MNRQFYLYGFSLGLMMISGCSTSPRIQHNNLPTQVDIVSLDLSNMQWKLRLKHRHQDTRKGSRIACQMSFDSRHLSFLPQKLPDLTINAIEIITVQNIEIDAEPSDVLRKERTSVEYRLSCQLSSDNFSTETINKNSVLYPVPGQQNLYR